MESRWRVLGFNFLRSGFRACLAFLAAIIVALTLCVQPSFAASEAKVHFLALPANLLAVLVECDGHFGMIDSGEDVDYPDGTDPMYPDRPAITKSFGFDDEVIDYLYSQGVTPDNFDFYIGTHPHSDHIGTADTVIREFHPKRVYTPEYHDYYLSDPARLFDNLYQYDNLIEATLDVGASLIMKFDPSAPVDPRDASDIASYSLSLQNSLALSQDAIPDSDYMDVTSDAVMYSDISNDGVAPAQLGRYEDIVSQMNVVGNPVFTLGDGLRVEIVNYVFTDEDVPTHDANDLSFGVLLESNDVRMFIAGDIDNFRGKETVLGQQIGDVDLFCLGHHGYYGSNSPSYVEALNPEVVVLPGDYSYVSDKTSTDIQKSTRDILLDWSAEGVPVYPVALYSKQLDALVFNFDENLSNNVPSGFEFVGATYQTKKPEFIHYTDGLVTSYDGVFEQNGSLYVFDNSPFGGLGHIVEQDGYFWYQFASGEYAYDYWLDEGDTYRYFNSDGHMAIGWLNDEGWWCYFDESGLQASGWQYIDSNWYYFEPEHDGYYGYMYVGRQWVHDGWYIFNNRHDGTYGSLLSGWAYADDNWFYLNPYHDGSYGLVMAGWLYDNNTWYYLNDMPGDIYGAMQTGWVYLNGTYYFMNSSGAMQTGWLYNNGSYYYLSSSGSMQTGWLYRGGSYFYLSHTGAMQTGWIYINGDYFYSDSSGYMLTGWQYIDGCWYFFSGGGYMAHDTWVGNYYMGPSGAMMTNTITPDGYEVDENGLWVR